MTYVLISLLTHQRRSEPWNPSWRRCCQTWTRPACCSVGRWWPPASPLRRTSHEAQSRNSTHCAPPHNRIYKPDGKHGQRASTCHRGKTPNALSDKNVMRKDGDAKETQHGFNRLTSFPSVSNTSNTRVMRYWMGATSCHTQFLLGGYSLGHPGVEREPFSLVTKPPHAAAGGRRRWF